MPDDTVRVIRESFAKEGRFDKSDICGIHPALVLVTAYISNPLIGEPREHWLDRVFAKLPFSDEGLKLVDKFSHWLLAEHLVSLVEDADIHDYLRSAATLVGKQADMSQEEWAKKRAALEDRLREVQRTAQGDAFRKDQTVLALSAAVCALDAYQHENFVAMMLSSSISASRSRNSASSINEGDMTKTHERMQLADAPFFKACQAKFLELLGA